LADNYFYNLEILDFLHYHNMWEQDVSLIIKAQEKTKWYGNIKLQWNSIIKFVEKPEKKEDISFIVNAGVYIINTNVLPNKPSNNKIEKWFFSDYAPTWKMSWSFHNGAWFHVQSNEILKELWII
jgi:NDP-sugar pyrophosphorylase family protein